MADMWNTVLNKSIKSWIAGINGTNFYEKLRGEKLSISKKFFLKPYAFSKENKIFHEYVIISKRNFWAQ